MEHNAFTLTAIYVNVGTDCFHFNAGGKRDPEIQIGAVNIMPLLLIANPNLDSIVGCRNLDFLYIVTQLALYLDSLLVPNGHFNATRQVFNQHMAIGCHVARFIQILACYSGQWKQQGECWPGQ